MRLVRLRLQNYRRHVDTAIEWPDGVTALIGRNGSGKSSILEAIGFALFGAGATRTAKELLRHDGAAPSDHVRVDLEAEIGEHAVHIVRELRGKNLTPNASIDVDGIVQAAPGAGSNDAVTQQVESLLGMGREAFFTTVVARQKELAGLADVSPAERKRRILHMMGIDRLEEAIQAARQRRREAEHRADAVRSVLDDRAGLRKAVNDAEAAVGRAKKRVAEADLAWDATKKALDRAATDRERREAAVAAYTEAEHRLVEAQRQVSVHQAVARQANEQRDAARRAAAEADALRPDAEALSQAEAALAAAQEAARAHAEHRKAVAHAEDLQKEAARLADAVPPRPDAPAGLDAADAALGTARDALETARRDEALARQHAHALRARHEKLAALSTEAPCPTCEQPLGPRHGHVVDAVHAELAKAHADVRKAEGAVASHARSVAEAEARRRACQAAEGAYRQDEVAWREARTRAEDAAERARTVSVPEAVPAPPDEAPLRAAVARARAAHEARVAALVRVEGLDEAMRRAGDAEQALEASRAAAAAARAALAAMDDPRPAAQQAREAHEAARRAEREAERGAQQARHDATLGEEALKDARRRLDDDARRRASLEALEEDARYWAALAGARRDGLLDGFRDHLVQRIGPAIAHEAGRLLGRFTGGRYDEVLLDEDYRLYVTDGGLPYQIDRFSGGEADLVHLALRLAVSRLLAERGGAGEVRFLALDEVFGSLDAERRALVTGALQELGTLYAQVLLVTHLEDMRDALDQTISVEDGAVHMHGAPA